jgi:hypothetical protein
MQTFRCGEENTRREGQKGLTAAAASSSFVDFARKALMKIRGMAGKVWGAAESWAKRNTMATKHRHGRLRRCAIDMKTTHLAYKGASCSAIANK